MRTEVHDLGIPPLDKLRDKVNQLWLKGRERTRAESAMLPTLQARLLRQYEKIHHYLRVTIAELEDERDALRARIDELENPE